MTRPLDVCIRGDGIVGHVLALLFARERLRVGLVCDANARASHLTDVRAYALNHQSRDLLTSLRCWPDPAQATPVLAMQVRQSGGGEVNFDAQQQGVAALAWIVDVASLQAQLADALRFQSGVELLPQPRDATLTVVCEGRDSGSRRQFGVEWEVTDYAQWAIAARVHCALPHRGMACQWFGAQDITGFLPLDGEGGNSMAIVWSVHSEHYARWMEIDPELFAQQLQSTSEDRFGRLALTSARAAWPLQLANARRWSGVTGGASWVLAGDAAHVVHPLAGQGLNLGLADAQQLAHEIHSRDYWRGVNDAKLLRRYERSRKADVALMGAATDGLQRLFSRSGAAWQGVRQWGMAGFDNSAVVKRWVASRAMGSADNELATINKTT